MRARKVEGRPFKVSLDGQRERIQRIKQVTYKARGTRTARLRQTRRAQDCGTGSANRRVVVKVISYDRGKPSQFRKGSVIADKLNYIEKDGPLFSQDPGAVPNKGAIAQEWHQDRNFYQFIVSPEDGGRLSLDEMRDAARDIVRAWERHTGPLEWVASAEEKPDSAHPDGNKHLHILVRGVQDDRNLEFNRDLMLGGFDREASRVLTDRLGPMNLREIDALDRRIEMNRQRTVEVRGTDRSRDQHERDILE